MVQWRCVFAMQRNTQPRHSEKLKNSRNIVFFCAHWNSINYLRRMTRRNGNGALFDTEWVSVPQNRTSRGFHFSWYIEELVKCIRFSLWVCSRALAYSRCLYANYFNFNQLHCVPCRERPRSPSTHTLTHTANDYCYYLTSSEMKSHCIQNVMKHFHLTKTENAEREKWFRDEGRNAAEMPRKRVPKECHKSICSIKIISAYIIFLTKIYHANITAPTFNRCSTQSE